MHPDQKTFYTRCNCAGGCTFLVIDKWDNETVEEEEEYWADLYQSLGKGKWPLRDRLKRAFNELRSKDNYNAGMIISKPEARRLRDWLTERLENSDQRRS